MNHNALKNAETYFLQKYPGGFQHPELLAIGKKHKIEEITKILKTKSFIKVAFAEPAFIIHELGVFMSRASMVSTFEKIKFRNMLNALSLAAKRTLSRALEELIHGSEAVGFSAWCNALAPHKLNKWAIVSAPLAYYRPRKDVFIKPTTIKLIIAKLELDIPYQAAPNWELYKKYRSTIQMLKKQVHASLSPNHPAFSGFLMMSLNEL